MKKVLVVEDEPFSMELVLEIVKALGFKADEAGNGEEAIHKEVPAVALTSYAMKGERNRFIETGFDDYIAKPIDCTSS